MTTIHPDCQLPDGAEPCAGYSQLQRETERLRAMVEGAIMAKNRLNQFADMANAGRIHYDARELKRRIWGAFAQLDEGLPGPENATMVTPRIFTRAEWFTLDIKTKHRWWEETDFGRIAPPWELERDIRTELGRPPRECPPQPPEVYERGPCHICGSITESESVGRCKKSPCGAVFDLYGYAVAPTPESLSAHHEWAERHADCFEECVAAPPAPGDDNASSDL